MKFISREHYQSMKTGILSRYDVMLVKDGATTGKVGYWNCDDEAAVNEHVYILRSNTNKVMPFYLYSVVKSVEFQSVLKRYIKGIIGGISREILKIKIPLPPLEIQRQIVAELDGYQKIIDAANTIVQSYKPTIKINPDWELNKIDDIININFGTRITKKDAEGTKYPVYGGGGRSFMTDEYNRENEYVISRFAMSENCVRFVGEKFFMLDSGFTFEVKNTSLCDKDYIGHILLSIQDKIYQCARGHAQKNIDMNQFRDIKIPLPPLEIQRQIVAELEVEQELINANKKLIDIYTQKIKTKLAEIWGE